MTEPARLVVIDDDPAARGAIANALAGVAGLAIVGEGETGARAIELIEELAPDAVLLDVQLPDVDGFGVVDAIGAERMPPVVFVTAYDHHAIKAFDVLAIDYVLKPFTDDRLRLAVVRALQRRGAPRPAVAPAHLSRFTIRDGYRIRFIAVGDVDWIEADGNYVRLHAGEDEHLLRETLRLTLARLDPSRFVQIHRSTIVNVDRVAEVQPWFGGDYVAILRTGHRLRVSRTYKRGLMPRA